MCIKKGCNELFGVYYCSLQCQIKDWNNHKVVCPGAKVTPPPTPKKKHKIQEVIEAMDEEQAVEKIKMMLCLNCGNPKCRFAKQLNGDEIPDEIQGWMKRRGLWRGA